MNCIKTYLPLALVLLLVGLIIPSIPIAAASDSPRDPALYSNDWRNTGPPGGDVRGLVVDPSNPDRFYFGTLDGQIYTSSDAGETWQLLYNFGRPKLCVDHIIVDPRNARTIHRYSSRVYEPGGATPLPERR